MWGDLLVPGYYLPTNANGFTDGISQLIGSGVDRLTMDLVRPARIVLNAACNFGNIFVECNRIRFAWKLKVLVAIRALYF